MSHDWVFDKESFYDFLGYVAQCAPEFPEEDFLEDDEQLDTEKAFRELQNGLSIIRNELSESVFRDAQQRLDSSLMQYRNGDDIGGSRILQELDRMIFGKGLPPSAEKSQ